MSKKNEVARAMSSPFIAAVVRTRVAPENIQRWEELHMAPDAACELCGDEAELRPYGPQGERVCYPCGKKDPEALRRGVEKMFGWSEEQ